MKVILKQDVPNLGRAGDIKTVKTGYARNFLLPKNYVMRATARTEKEKAFLEKVQNQKIQKRKKTAEETAKSIENKTITFVAKISDEGKMFGSITNIKIQQELEKEGIVIDKKTILLDENIKTLGKYEIDLKFYEGITSKINVVVQDEEGNTELVEIKSDLDEVNEESNQEDSEVSSEEVVTEEENSQENELEKSE